MDKRKSKKSNNAPRSTAGKGTEMRLRRAVGDKTPEAGGPGTWADLALQFGYYDQAHLVRDVRFFTGVTPTDARGMLIDLS